MSYTDDLLADLHAALLRDLLRRIQSGEEVKPADLEVARKFLADNKVTADLLKSREGRTLTSAVANLPFTDEDA
ncbi:hypothetical protein NON00_02265 [Roseomonas sp. GC11]|uniref:hypothetical protein n=1 Tax=Roseomonas sp. GC11 TaxID=2950546 RepID=UPI00210B5A6F|nr:hypothetical protein [Roseomonas sp. GC11]MCQ4158751.1 hypothetical protein [Roseomonas sp. GC11]